jgi:hypothetical protein
MSHEHWTISEDEAKGIPEWSTIGWACVFVLILILLLWLLGEPPDPKATNWLGEGL